MLSCFELALTHSAMEFSLLAVAVTRSVLCQFCVAQKDLYH